MNINNNSLIFSDFSKYASHIDQAGRSWQELKTNGDRVVDESFKNTLSRLPLDEEIQEVQGKPLCKLTDKEKKEARQSMEEVLGSKGLVEIKGVAVEPQFQYVYSPSMRGLAYQCLYYGKKYGIDMFASVATDVDTILKRVKGKVGNLFGIILESFRDCTGHVSPVIFYRKKAVEPWTVILLDSVGGNIDHRSKGFGYYFFHAKCMMNAEVQKMFELKQSTQYSSMGCRVDAVVRLRNFLLYLKNLTGDFDPLKVLKATPSEKGPKLFLFHELPDALAHISQAWRSKPLNDAPLPKEQKKAKPMLLSVFHQTFVKDVQVKEEIQFKERDFKVVIQRSSTRNVYLVYKGAQVMRNIFKGMSSVQADELEERILKPYQ